MVAKSNPDVMLYVGSTWQTLRGRWSRHKSDAKLHPDRKVFEFIRENGGFDCFELVLLERTVTSTHTCERMVI